MYSEINNDTITNLIKSNPDFEAVIQKIIQDNKQTTTMFVHELRNPLSLMKGTLQYIEAKHPETKDFKYWDQLHELVHDLENMMADASLLNTCNSIKKEKCDLLSLIKGMKNNFMPQAINQNIDLDIILRPGCETYFSSYECDCAKIKQVLSNLIKNAFEATTPGNFIHIILDYLAGNQQIPQKLSIQVSNNGLPIPEDEINSIFIPFVTYKKGGTGVGLAVVKKIIDLHYGSVSVTSKEEETCFTILLPL
ncbi:HAMP domain-containing histidine kinase [Mobilitalea sibirica]|uniref:histidine kinase n=1 Tax=Mobilitalea sibirica TaxID=1462919 RepID=A0A8J7H2X8_9FIRM|nr:HAMP domain-containing sensor histidine kinase [Mobilitalea sibirica]MBH1941025.1 HAMP domain-containing histidine kinase [Mobilitalea sibirica]